MKAYETAEIRNVALIGHGDSGKTALTSAVLFGTGAVNRVQVKRVADADGVVVEVRVDVALLVDGHADDFAHTFTERDVKRLRARQIRGALARALCHGAVRPPEVTGVADIHAQTNELLGEYRKAKSQALKDRKN